MIRDFIPFSSYLKYFFKRLTLKIKRPDVGLGENVSFAGVVFGKNVHVGDNSILINCVLGDYTYFSINNVIKRAVIGNFCSIGPNVIIAPGFHPTKTFVSTSPVFYNPNNMLNVDITGTKTFEDELHVKVGNDVWIGANVILADGVTIGDGVIIAANSFVKDNVPDYAIVAGCPAKILRYRFTEDLIDKLKVSRWWDRDINYLKQHVDLFQNVDLFDQHFK